MIEVNGVQMAPDGVNVGVRTSCIAAGPAHFRALGVRNEMARRVMGFWACHGAVRSGRAW